MFGRIGEDGGHWRWIWKDMDVQLQRRECYESLIRICYA